MLLVQVSFSVVNTETCGSAEQNRLNLMNYWSRVSFKSLGTSNAPGETTAAAAAAKVKERFRRRNKVRMLNIFVVTVWF